jgi:hypothetical protein
MPLSLPLSDRDGDRYLAGEASRLDGISFRPTDPHAHRPTHRYRPGADSHDLASGWSRVSATLVRSLPHEP